MAGLPLKIRLRVNNNLPVLNADGNELELLNLWGDNPELSLTREEKPYQDSNCVVATAVTSELNIELVTSSRDLLLLPQVQYRAQLIAGTEAIIYEFAFLTSRYANFRHQVHSFADICWNNFDLLGDAAYEINPDVLKQVLTNEEVEYVTFEQLMKVFDLNLRQLPERLEVTLLNDKNQSYGFLLETPEPLDWECCQWTIQFTNKTDAVEEFYNTVKIIGGSVQTDLRNPNNDWVEILLMETTDLSAFIIEYRNLDFIGDAYAEFFHFQEDSSYNCGTLIRILDGTEAASPSVENENIYLYAGKSSPVFSTGGTSIRIKDKNGLSLHSRVIYRENIFNESGAVSYRNEDGTRFFIFVKKGTEPYSELKRGIYQISFTYKRDLEQDQPVLKRFGFSDSEEAVIAFSCLDS